MFVVLFLLFFITNQLLACPSVTRESVAQECILPSVEEIHWDQIPGDWYETLSPYSTVDEESNCFGTRSIRPAPDGAFITNVDYHVGSSTYQEILIHAIRQDNESYVFDPKFEFEWFAPFMEDARESDAAPYAVSYHIYEIFDGRFTFLTDYKNYFIFLMCGPTDDKHMWVHTPKRHHSAEDVIRIVNKLIDVGNGWNNIPLHLACRTVKDVTKFKSVN